MDPALVAEASRAVVGAVDGWVLARPEVSAEASASQLRALLEAVWAAGV